MRSNPMISPAEARKGPPTLYDVSRLSGVPLLPCRACSVERRASERKHVSA